MSRFGGARGWRSPLARAARKVAKLMDVLPRPLDPVRSIKIKLGVLLVSAGFAGLSVFWIGIGWIPYATSITAIVIALATSQVLAHGMTSPLREMTAAARDGEG